MIEDCFIPVRVHVRDNASEYKKLSERFGANWTPTILITDWEGKERHRIEGFLPADELLPQLALGLGKVAFAQGDFEEAERHDREILARHPDSAVAPEAQYWAGVAHYKATNDPAALAETARAFGKRYSNTPWAQKASVWG